MKRKFFACLLALSAAQALLAQPERWQQRVEYQMDIDMDVDKHRFKGKQTLKYVNNSPDTLTKVFYHLYFNAFQPGSDMDNRVQFLPDPDDRLVVNKGTKDKPVEVSRISLLKPSETGYQRIDLVQQNGKPVKAFHIEGTVLEVELNEPILPGSSTALYMEFNAQVPVQIRRSGRDNDEGISYSMTQWYPKLCEYDYQGWHAHPYIGREFYGVWGDFDVKITLDKRFLIGGTGYLQNPNEIGHGYEKPGTPVDLSKKERLTWHFKAPNVHDFAWAADPDYKHETAQVPGGPTLHFLYENKPELEANWRKLQDYAVKAFQFMSATFGKYPYEQFTVIQGGDGGMEYPMATLITGKRTLSSLVGVTVHEGLHNWYFGVLGSNESLYPWMDEGFTSYASSITMNHLFNYGKANPSDASYEGYYQLVNSGVEQPLITPGDHYNTSFAYWAAAYSKGAVFLAQLEYILGKPTFDRALLRYFDVWKFKHPNPNDFIRVFEKESGLELDWYREYWVNTTFTIDYKVADIDKKGGKTIVRLERKGIMPMPIDVEVTYKDGRREIYYIPLDLMRGEKPKEDATADFFLQADWHWVDKTYLLTIPAKEKEIEKVVIDPKKRMADVERENNEKTP